MAFATFVAVICHLSSTLATTPTTTDAPLPSTNPETKFHLPSIPNKILEKFEPFAQKLEDVSSVLSLPYHPNYGGLLFWSPQYVLEQLWKKKNELWPVGSQAAVFGEQKPHQEYPWAYRKS